MEEHEHHKTLEETTELPVSKPEKTIAGSIIIAAIIIAASIIYSGSQLGKNISGGSSIVYGQQTAPTAQTGQPQAPVNVADRDNEPVLGNKDAKVTIVEFADFQCPFCKSFFQQSFNDIKTKYIDTGKVKYVFRHFPLTNIHVNAEIAGVAAECANNQGKFWQYHDLLYTNGQADGTNLDKASLEKYASSLGLNSGTLGLGKNKFNQCLENNSTLAIVQADQQEGVKAGITGTPSFFINGKSIVGAQPTAVFEQAIEAALK